VRTHGWSGNPPANDEEAAERILAAAIECVEELGLDADVAKVAQRVGVTRQTVYRYFPSRSALFAAVALHGTGSLVERLIHHLGDVTATEDAVIEMMMFCLRTLPDDPQLAFVAQPGRADALIMSEGAPELAKAVLRRLPVHFGTLDGDAFDALAEHMVRLIQALLLDASTAARSDDDLRRFLHACLDHHLEGVTAR
jgi:AcrR family transcriptional regulator